MDGSIYDFGLQRSAFGSVDPVWLPAPVSRARGRAIGRVGLITNPRSHRNRGGARPEDGRADVLSFAPRTREELRDVLAMFAQRRIDLLAIDGGDGTVRDVLTCAGDAWRSAWPDIALLPSGKTNALAVDLGVPARWSLDDALTAARRGRVVRRRPLEIENSAAPGVAVRGFIFGAGAFVTATALAQRTHRAGAFDGVAVGLALAWGIGQTLFGNDGSDWRRGSRITLRYADRATRMHGSRPDGSDDRYLMVASTLHRLPLGIKPFGPPRGGLKTLVVDAPPRRLGTSLAPLLAGSQSPALDANGYHRIDTESVAIDIATSFILDGETFPPGSYLLREAQPLRFVAP